jgi:SAM-dependent methyltransferase
VRQRETRFCQRREIEIGLRISIFLSFWFRRYYNNGMTDSRYWDQIWTERPAMGVNNFARRAFIRIQAAQLQTLLDIGCGTGQDALYFARRGLQVTALDIATAGLERLRARESRITCLAKDVCALDFPNDSFEVIYAHLSLHYFDDLQTRRVFHSINDTLAPGGLFFVKCKSVDDRLYGEGEQVGPDMFFYRHLRHFFSLQYMAGLLETFRIISLRRTSSHYGRFQSSFIEAVATK